MKIFVEIPVFRNDEFKVAAVKAIRSLSYPIMSIMDAKKIIETPGWHRIYNNVLKPLSKTKHDLINFVIDYEKDTNAIEAYGGRVMLYLHNGEPAGYKPPTPTPELDSAGLRMRPAPTPKPLTQEQMNSMHVVFAILDHAIREAVSLGKYDEIPDIAKAAAFLLTLTKIDSNKE